eukprot:CAMPEP_0183528918 /NCGR_PEP_ID=MMETSP0371-20130417/23049_1 /TAXON_ID=268820 /ORGANISM="Peridinium aciculiferum, Strain PAER-2" /LENGTH=58 /DNA_ID=CAMNT_0025728603 /DNA_START=58 /DNA_END=234 /DNA_ORIENTATION=+
MRKDLLVSMSNFGKIDWLNTNTIKLSTKPTFAMMNDRFTTPSHKDSDTKQMMGCDTKV